MIEFRIPNGIMRIDAETFFSEATRPKIRKHLSIFRIFGLVAEDVHKIKDWLQEEIDKENRLKNDKLAKRYKSILEDACKILN